MGGADHWIGRDEADVATACASIRAERGLPNDALFALLDDMAAITSKSTRWNCASRSKYGLAVCGDCEWCAHADERAVAERRRQAGYRDRRRAEASTS